ncbi:MAG: hypothetical protein ACTSVV_14385, partial [Promethearchaeota archaeon]
PIVNVFILIKIFVSENKKDIKWDEYSKDLIQALSRLGCSKFRDLLNIYKEFRDRVEEVLEKLEIFPAYTISKENTKRLYEIKKLTSISIRECETSEIARILSKGKKIYYLDEKVEKCLKKNSSYIFQNLINNRRKISLKDIKNEASSFFVLKRDNREEHKILIKHLFSNEILKKGSKENPDLWKKILSKLKVKILNNDLMDHGPNVCKCLNDIIPPKRYILIEELMKELLGEQVSFFYNIVFTIDYEFYGFKKDDISNILENLPNIKNICFLGFLDVLGEIINELILKENYFCLFSILRNIKNQYIIIKYELKDLCEKNDMDDDSKEITERMLNILRLIGKNLEKSTDKKIQNQLNKFIIEEKFSSILPKNFVLDKNHSEIYKIIRDILEKINDPKGKKETDAIICDILPFRNVTNHFNWKLIEKAISEKLDTKNSRKNDGTDLKNFFTQFVQFLSENKNEWQFYYEKEPSDSFNNVKNKLTWIPINNTKFITPCNILKIPGTLNLQEDKILNDFHENFSKIFGNKYAFLKEIANINNIKEDQVKIIEEIFSIQKLTDKIIEITNELLNNKKENTTRNDKNLIIKLLCFLIHKKTINFFNYQKKLEKYLEFLKNTKFFPTDKINDNGKIEKCYMSYQELKSNRERIIIIQSTKLQYEMEANLGKELKSHYFFCSYKCGQNLHLWKKILGRFFEIFEKDQDLKEPEIETNFKIEPIQNNQNPTTENEPIKPMEEFQDKMKIIYDAIQFLKEYCVISQDNKYSKLIKMDLYLDMLKRNFYEKIIENTKFKLTFKGIFNNDIPIGNVNLKEFYYCKETRNDDKIIIYHPKDYLKSEVKTTLVNFIIEKMVKDKENLMKNHDEIINVFNILFEEANDSIRKERTIDYFFIYFKRKNIPLKPKRKEILDDTFKDIINTFKDNCQNHDIKNLLEFIKNNTTITPESEYHNYPKK